MTEPNVRRFDTLFDTHGVDAIRSRLSAHTGVSLGAAIYGLGTEITDMPSRTDAEDWLRRREAEREARLEQRAARQDRWTKVGVCLAGIAALVATLSWLLPIR